MPDFVQYVTEFCLVRMCLCIKFNRILYSFLFCFVLVCRNWYVWQFNIDLRVCVVRSMSQISKHIAHAKVRVKFDYKKQIQLN